MDGHSQIKVHTDERTLARSSLMVTHPSTNRGRRTLTSVLNFSERATELALVDTVNNLNNTWKYE